MPLTQAEMDFFTRHAYELHNFDRPTPAHDFLRNLCTTGRSEWRDLSIFQYLWQEQSRYDGTSDTFFSWAPPAHLPALAPPWSTWREFVDRAESLYAESVYRQFEANEHPLRYAHFISTRKGRFLDKISEFTPAEDEFLDAYYREIFSYKKGPCLSAVNSLDIPVDEVNTLVAYRATELMHAGQSWPQLDTVGPPIPWSSLDEFKQRFFPPRPNFPRCHYVTLHRTDLSAKEQAFFHHCHREFLSLTPGPAHEYLRAQDIAVTLLSPFWYAIFRGGGHGLAGLFVREALPPFEIPWSSKTVFYQRAYYFCPTEREKEAFSLNIPLDDREYITTSFRELCYPNQFEDEFIEWYLAETAGKTNGFTPATNWLWTHGVYPTNLKVMIYSAQHPPGNWHDVEYDNPLPSYKPAWVDKDEFNERLKKFLRAYPEFNKDPTALPNYAPEGYEQRRMAWLRSIPAPPRESY
jgi:hypothetical protein